MTDLSPRRTSILLLTLVYSLIHQRATVKIDDVALVPRSAGGGSGVRPTVSVGAYLGVDEDLDEPTEVVILCPTCAESEFGDPEAQRTRR